MPETVRESSKQEPGTNRNCSVPCRRSQAFATGRSREPSSVTARQVGHPSVSHSLAQPEYLGAPGPFGMFFAERVGDHGPHPAWVPPLTRPLNRDGAHRPISASTAYSVQCRTRASCLGPAFGVWRGLLPPTPSPSSGTCVTTLGTVSGGLVAGNTRGRRIRGCGAKGREHPHPPPSLWYRRNRPR